MRNSFHPSSLANTSLANQGGTSTIFSSFKRAASCLSILFVLCFALSTCTKKKDSPALAQNNQIGLTQTQLGNSNFANNQQGSSNSLRQNIAAPLPVAPQLRQTQANSAQGITAQTTNIQNRNQLHPSVTNPAFNGGTPLVPLTPASPGSAGVVALTFDDGPHPTRTKQLLDILARENVVATFYVVGRSLEANQSLLQRMVSEGHELGNHTWDHPNLVSLSRSKGMAQVKSQLQRTQNKIIELTGQTPRTFRPPYGAVNQSIRSMVQADFGMSTTLWTVDPKDWKKPGVQVVTQRVVSRARPNGILLLHDIHQSSVDAVPGIISGLKAKGYRFVTVSALQGIVKREATQEENKFVIAPSFFSAKKNLAK